MVFLFSGLLAAAAGVGGTIYTRQYLKKNEVEITHRKKWIFIAVTAVLFAAVAVLLPLFNTPDDRTAFAVLRAEALIFGTYFLAFIDYKLRVIPNRYLLVMLVAVVVMFAAEAIIDMGSFRLEIMLSLLGSVICGLLFLVTNILSKNGLGMGDVKLIFIAGLYVGLDEILGGLVWAMAFSLGTGIALMIMKKAKLKTKIPMAPFFFLGFLVSNIIYTISGVVGG